MAGKLLTDDDVIGNPSSRAFLSDEDVIGAPKKAEPQTGALEAGARAAYDAATFGFAPGTDRARNKLAREEHPYASIAGDVAGIGAQTAALGPLAAAGRAAQGVGRVVGLVPRAAEAILAPSMSGRGVAGTVLTGARAGAAGAAAHGAGSAIADGASADDAVSDAAREGIVGGVTGGIAAPLLRAAGNAIGRSMAREPAAPGGLTRETADNLVNSLRSTPEAEANATLGRLGTEGRVADVAPALQQDAKALATRGDAASEVLRDATGAGGAGDRIEHVINNAISHPVDPHQVITAIEQRGASLAEPFYTQFRQTPIPTTPQIQNIATHIGISDPSLMTEAYRRAMRDSLRGNASPPNWFAQQTPQGWAVTRMPSAAEWDYIKRAADGLADTTDKTTRGHYRDMARIIRDAVDEAVSPGNPSASPWAQGRAVHAEHAALVDALDAGRTVFEKGVGPSELRQLVGDLGSQPERQAFDLGIRESIRKAMHSATGASDDPAADAARRLFSSREAQDKLRMLYGPDEAQRMVEAARGAGQAAGTNRAIESGLQTAERQAAKGRYGQSDARNPLDTAAAALTTAKSVVTNPVGAAAGAVQKIVGMVAAEGTTVRNQEQALQAARALVRQGTDAQQLVSELYRYMAAQDLSRAQRQFYSTLATRISKMATPGAATATADAVVGKSQEARP